tara:strand:- start:30 stop:191 length:162 start_codon:yes stop_codon:yes gene_type:complete
MAGCNAKATIEINSILDMPDQADSKSRFVRFTTNVLPHTASFLVSFFENNQQY